MFEYIYLLLSLAFFFCCSKNIVSLSFILIGHFYFLLIMLGYFHLFKFNGNFSPFFPDELTYINGDTDLLYSLYVHQIYPYLSETFFRIVNLFFYFLSWTLVFNENKKGDFTLFDFGCVLIATAGLYWCFFLLKESMSITGLIFLYLGVYKARLMYKSLSFLMLVLARVDLLVFYLLSFLALKIYNISTKLFVFFIVFTSLLVYYFLNSSISYPLKLMFGSRRFGESNKQFDEALISVSKGGAFDYIFSNVYLETVVANVRRTFDPLFSGVSLASILIVVNLFAILYFIKYRLIERKFYYYDCYFLFVTVILMATHSVYRYMNVVVISYFSALFIYKKIETARVRS